MSTHAHRPCRLAAMTLMMGLLLSAGAGCGEAQPWTPPSYDGAFNQAWRDGHAELATYRLTYPRYGELRGGTAVAITVTEPFNNQKRVKSDRGGEGSVGVLKLNLIEDFQTGVYDYNLMTSVFVATQPVNGLPAGSATKVSFSSQEWCGHVYQQALFSQTKRGTPGVRQTVHSYFEQEADQQVDLDHPEGGIAEDALMLWARGLAGPRLEPGESVEVPVYRSMAVQRLGHVPAAWETGELHRSLLQRDIETADMGVFPCDEFTAKIEGREYRFYVDAAADGDRRLVKVTRSDGYALELIGVERLPYWELNDNADESELKKIGLERRGEAAM